MKRKSYKKIILATLISVLIMIGSASAVYATQPYVSEQLILSQETVDAIATGISKDGKVIAWNYDYIIRPGVPVASLKSNATILSGNNWAKKQKSRH